MIFWSWSLICRVQNFLILVRRKQSLVYVQTWKSHYYLVIWRNDPWKSTAKLQKFIKWRWKWIFMKMLQIHSAGAKSLTNESAAIWLYKSILSNFFEVNFSTFRSHSHLYCLQAVFSWASEYGRGLLKMSFLVPPWSWKQVFI